MFFILEFLGVISEIPQQKFRENAKFLKVKLKYSIIRKVSRIFRIIWVLLCTEG